MLNFKTQVEWRASIEETFSESRCSDDRQAASSMGEDRFWDFVFIFSQHFFIHTRKL